MTGSRVGAGATTGRRAPRLRGLVAAVAAALTLFGSTGTPRLVHPTEAAGLDLTMVATTRYAVDPAKHRVHVTVDLRATNHRTDTKIRRYYIDHASLAVMPGTSAFAVTAVRATAHPTVHVASHAASQTLLAIGFGTKLGSGRTMTLRLSFDLVDRGGASSRTVRIGTALATFPVWAYGTAGTSGGSVSVVLPAGYRVAIQGSALHGPAKGSGGTVVYTSGSLSQPLTYATYVVADRPGAYRETPIALTVAGAPMSVVVRAWRDDATFGTKVGTAVRRALPALGSLIGIPAHAGSSPLAVEEAISRALGGYAAQYDPSADRIAVAYDASPGVVLREVAHTWFNGTLLADRWAAEGFASYYAVKAAGPLKIGLPKTPLTKTLLAARIPLNAWSGGGRPVPTTDAYATAASLELANLIAKRAGAAGLTAVWSAAAAREAADQPVHGGPVATSGTSDGTAAPAPDWRGLLDLLETRTGQSYTDLWRTWVVRPDEAAILDERTRARADYTAVIAEAGDWELPRTIRSALDDWRFADASRLIADARAVLAQRASLADAAHAAGLVLPTGLRTAFEGAGGTAAAASEATAEKQAIARISADAAARPTTTDPVTSIGLMDAHPDAALATARAAFAAGDLSGAVQAADTARATWTDAVDVGRGRLALVALVLALFGIVVLLATRLWGRRRTLRAAPAMPLARTYGPAPRRWPPARAGGRITPMAHRLAGSAPGPALSSTGSPGSSSGPPGTPATSADHAVEPPTYATLAGTLPGEGPTPADGGSGDER